MLMNLDALHSSMDILIAGRGVLIHFELNCSLTDSTVWNTGETGVIYRQSPIFLSLTKSLHANIALFSQAACNVKAACMCSATA